MLPHRVLKFYKFYRTPRFNEVFTNKFYKFYRTPRFNEVFIKQILQILPNNKIYWIIYKQILQILPNPKIYWSIYKQIVQILPNPKIYWSIYKESTNDPYPEPFELDCKLQPSFFKIHLLSPSHSYPRYRTNFFVTELPHQNSYSIYIPVHSY